MANVKITELTALINPASSDVLPIVDVGADETKKVTIADLLENAGSGTASAAAFAFDGDADTGMYRAGANALGFTTGGTGRLFIDSSGNVGIGTTSVAAKLQVSVDNDHTDQGNTLAVRGTSGSWAAHLGATSEGGALVARGNVSTKGSLIFGATDGSYASYTERARIDSSGRLLVGTSSNSGGALLQVNGDRIRVATAKTPASASDTGTAGEICWDASYVYVCTATNTWKRAALSTW